MEKKKGFFKKLVDKVDKKMKEKAESSTCSCCGPSGSCEPPKKGKC